MKALQFRVSIPRVIMGKALGRYSDAVLFGPLSGLSLEDIATPELPGADWAQLDVLMCGICGSDTAGLAYKTSPVLEPFLSMPAVLGHEILARVRAVGADVTKVKVGDRVVIDPTISCVVRGRKPDEQCPACAAGMPSNCAKAGEDNGPSPHGSPLAHGLLLGANADLPGGFSERIIAHQSQIFRVRDDIDDISAVLTEPLSIGVHAVLNSAPDPEAEILVIGSGPIAFSTIWALRALGHRGAIVAQTKRPHEAALAKELGASSTVPPGSGAREALLGTGAVAFKPIIGDEVFAGGGYPIIFDCVGNGASLTQALRFIVPRGHIIIIGCASSISHIDLTFLWAREVRLSGYVGYGLETWQGEHLHTFEITQRLLSQTAAPVAELVTHSFPLARYREALSASIHRAKSSAIKVLLTPQ